MRPVCPSDWPSGWKSANDAARAALVKILILKPSSLGDVVHALPVLRLLKLSLPESQIHWWIDERLAPLLEGDPDIHTLHHFMRRGWHTPRGISQNLRTARTLRRERFDWVLDLQGLARSAVFAWVANGGLTLGPDSSREGARIFYDRSIPRPTPNAHAVDWNLAFLRELAVPVDRPFEWLPRRASAAQSVQQQASQHGKDCRWIFFCPGARWMNKRWPVAHFQELATCLLAADPALRIAIVGSVEDQPLGRAITSAGGARCLDLTGRTTLPELIEWLRLASVVITNDSAPMHLAAALGRPVVALFGPTHPGRTGPYHAPGKVLQATLPCVPCLRRTCAWATPNECLLSLTPAMVADAARAHLPAACG